MGSVVLFVNVVVSLCLEQIVRLSLTDAFELVTICFVVCFVCLNVDAALNEHKRIILSLCCSNLF